MSTRSVLVLLTLLVLASGVWGVWKVLRVEPLVPPPPIASSDSERSPSHSTDETSNALTDPTNELAAPMEGEDSRAAAPIDEVEGEKKPETVVHTGPTSAIHGVLLDEDTREPLPEFVLQLQDEDGARIDVKTDAQGRFVTPIALAHGNIEVRPIDLPSRRWRPPPITHAHPVPEGEEFQIETPSGATFRLAIEPANVPVNQLEARLRISGKDVRGSQEYDPVREGNPPWVRLPPISGDALEARGLEVRDRGGIWIGRAEVNRLRGVAPGVVRVVLEPRSRLFGRVVDPRGEPIANANVSMSVTEGDKPGLNLTATTEADGSWHFDHLPRGTAALSATAFRYEAQRNIRALLVPGQATEQPITLNRLLPAGAIRGKVMSETGRYDLPSEAVLTSVENTGDGMAPQRAPITWHDGGSSRLVGSFEFADLPAGKYRVAARTVGSWYEISPEWKPASLYASPPDDSLQYLVLDNTPRADLVLRVTDVDSGAEVKDMRGWFSIGKKEGRARDLDSGEVAISGFPYDGTLRWRIDKAGYQPAIGDASSFGLETKQDGRAQRIAEVPLVRGWGELFRVSDVDGKQALAGARIFLDGRQAGETDSDGLVLIRAAAPPKEIKAEYKDWTMRNKIDRTPANRRKNPLFSAITMAPPRKRALNAK